MWIDQSEDDDFMKEKIANAENINVVGIIKQNEQSTATAMNGGIGYLKDLKEQFTFDQLLLICYK